MTVRKRAGRRNARPADAPDTMSRKTDTKRRQVRMIVDGISLTCRLWLSVICFVLSAL